MGWSMQYFKEIANVFVIVVETKTNEEELGDVLHGKVDNVLLRHINVPAYFRCPIYFNQLYVLLTMPPVEN